MRITQNQLCTGSVIAQWMFVEPIDQGLIAVEIVLLQRRLAKRFHRQKSKIMQGLYTNTPTPPWPLYPGGGASTAIDGISRLTTFLEKGFGASWWIDLAKPAVVTLRFGHSDLRQHKIS